MSVRTTTDPSGSARAVEAGLLARLGLPVNASTQEVEAAHDELIGFLEQAPADLRAWASREIAAIDEAYALLSDPTIDRSSLVAEVEAPTAAPTTSRRRRPSGRHPTPSTAAMAPAEPTTSDRTIRRAAILAASLVGIVVIAVVGYNMGGAPSVPGVAGTPDPVAVASPAVDTERVGELMQKIQADPGDVESLQALADTYYLANEFETAGGFLEKILTIDPQNLTARLALGAALFNTGKPTEAETHWRQVLTLDPDNLEAHYDLGFMYLSQKPANLAQAKVEWARVVEIAPGSEVAKSIEQHLASLDASPAPGSAASPAPTSGTTPARTFGTSPAPSGN